MPLLELNHASRPFKNNTLVWVGLMLTVVVLGGISVWNVRSFVGTTEALVDLTVTQEARQALLSRYEARNREAQREVERFNSTVGLDDLALKADNANEVIRWKAFSWTRLFNRLQDVQPYDVRMVSIHPVFRLESKTGRGDITADGRIPVSVEGEAKSIRDFFELERRLISSPFFSRVEPGSTQIDERGATTRFNLRFLYDPRTDVEVEADPISEEDPASATARRGQPGPAAAGARDDRTASVAGDDTFKGASELKVIGRTN